MNSDSHVQGNERVSSGKALWPKKLYKIIHAKIRRWKRVFELNRQVSRTKLVKVVIGAGEHKFDGWISTDLDTLDVTRAWDWAVLFRMNSIDRLLSEHVFEHLTTSDAELAFRYCYRYLKPGGSMRIAVPDGYRPDNNYNMAVAPPQDGHRTLYSIDLLSNLLRKAGFQVVPLEYFDVHGEFHAILWEENDGMVYRSCRFDRRDRFKWNENIYYTSLIMDAYKKP